jgi:hypothetical protein
VTFLVVDDITCTAAHKVRVGGLQQCSSMHFNTAVIAGSAHVGVVLRARRGAGATAGAPHGQWRADDAMGLLTTAALQAACCCFVCNEIGHGVPSSSLSGYCSGIR